MARDIKGLFEFCKGEEKKDLAEMLEVTLLAASKNQLFVAMGKHTKASGENLHDRMEKIDTARQTSKTDFEVRRKKLYELITAAGGSFPLFSPSEFKECAAEMKPQTTS